MERLHSLFGFVAILGAAWALCPKDRRRNVNRRTLAFGIVLLVVSSVIVLKTPVKQAFASMQAGVDALMGFCDVGSKFVFGEEIVNPGGKLGFVFFARALPPILFFSALMSVLYHLRILPMIVRFLGRTLSKVLGTSGAESFSTAADIFVGQTEAPLTIRPYLAKATLSELHACMTAGFATTAGAVLVTYATMLKPWIDGIAGHLIACSVLCAPASLVIAKLLLPENAEPETAGRTDLELPRSSTNLIDAIAAGTTDGLRLAVNVAGMLIVFIALTALLDAGLGYVWGLFQNLGGEVGGWLSREPWSLSMLFGWIFRPLAWVLGMPASDVPFAAALLGKKTVMNEWIAYQDMAQTLAKDPTALSERGRLILSYALCGFANFGSIGIQIGGYAALEPSRRGDFAKVALRAMIGGLLTTCLVAALVGVIA